MDCQEACKYNLSDRTLAPYWKLKNYPLFISASGDWDEAEKWRKSAEDIYSGVLEEVGKGKMRSDTEQQALRELREELDQVKKWRKKIIRRMIKEVRMSARPRRRKVRYQPSARGTCRR